MSLQLMKERIKQSGVSLYDEQIKDAQDILANGFIDDVSCAKHIFFWIAGENPQKGNHIYIKFYDRKYSSANGNMKSFLTHNNDKIEVGDYIYDEEENTYWICTESFHVDNIHYEGKFTQCNWFLKWQRSDGTILEYPCLDLNSTQYNSGESGNSTLKLGSAQHMEKVQANSDTIPLASPQRFYVSRDNSIPYIITQNDTTAINYGKGICNITVTQDVKREDKDRPDLGICDYIDPSTPLPPSPSNPDETTVSISAAIQGKKELKCGFPRSYSAVLSDEDGNAIDWNDTLYRWNVVSDFDVGQTVNGNQIELYVEDDSLIGESFLLQLIKSDGNFVITEIEIIVVDIV